MGSVGICLAAREPRKLDVRCLTATSVVFPVFGALGVETEGAGQVAEFGAVEPRGVLGLGSQVAVDL
ncbi:hypothetical protein GCM10009853_031390 [Glycomyces scopariae]